MKPKLFAPKSIESLEADALSAVKHRAFKDAIALFKDLLKRETRPAWKEQLAEAYLQRARQVAEKGMFQEATMLWESHEQYRPGMVPTDEYVGWLLRGGQHAKLVEVSVRLPVDSALTSRLPEILALLILDNEKLLAKLPIEHPAKKHHPLAKRAIAAYCAGKDAELEELLRQIPLRSPYRNLRSLLNALPLLEKDHEKALTWLEKIEAGSACRAIAEPLAKFGRTNAAGMFEAGLSAKTQAILLKLNGYTKSQLTLIKEFVKLERNLSPRRGFETALKFADSLGTAAAREYCRASLVEYPDGMGMYERKFGVLKKHERARIHALYEEHRRRFADAAHYWDEFLSHCDAIQENPDPMTSALVHRHVAQLARYEVPTISVVSLERSLELDPDDKPSYLELVRLHEEELDDSKSAQEVLERAIKRYPKDVDFLKLAMTNAAKRKAFKKAAGYAKTLLEIDPINPHARQFLIDAHLGHARKQFRAKRVDLARKEIQEARALDPQRRHFPLAFVDALLPPERGDHDQPALQEVWDKAGGGLCAAFQMIVEILELGLNTKGRPSLDAKYVPPREELLAFAKLLEQSAKEPKLRDEALAKLEPILNRGFKKTSLAEADFLMLCQALAKLEQYDLLENCVEEAIRHYPLSPGTIYYDVLVNCEGQPDQVDSVDEDRLYFALQQARKQNDTRMIALLGSFLHRIEEEYEDEYYDDEDDEELIDSLMPPGFEDMNLDDKKAAEIIKQLEKVKSYSPAELGKYLQGEVPLEKLMKMNEQEFLNLLICKVLRDAGMNPEALRDKFPLPSPHKSR